MTLKDSSSTNKVFAAALCAKLELSLGDEPSEAELRDDPALPELPEDMPFELMELDPVDIPESPDPLPEEEPDWLS